MINYDECKCTLQETSIDTSQEIKSAGEACYMTIDKREVVNFDKFLKKYFCDGNSKAKPPESVDAFCLLNGKWCLIEFKNGFVDRENIYSKIGHSTATILFKSNISPEEFKHNSIFILVYNKDRCIRKPQKNNDYFQEHLYLKPDGINQSKSLMQIQESIGFLAKKPIVRFGLDSFTNKYFSQTITMEKETFNRFIVEQEISMPT